MKNTKLQNKYTGEIVYCRNLNETVTSGDMVFIRVFTEENPQREYLTNKEAFDVIPNPP